MNSSSGNPTARDLRTALPTILRITLSLMLWTLGASMNLPAAKPKVHRVVYTFAVDRAQIENLQRW